MNYVLKKYDSLSDVIITFIKSIEVIERASLKEQYEILLCAKELNLNIPLLKRTLDTVKDADGAKLNLIDSLTRQVVLLKYDVNLDERIAFIKYWLEEGFYKNEDIVTISWVIGICIMDYDLLSDSWKEYIKKWIKKYCLKVNSLVTKSWFPYNLETFEEFELSRKVVASIISEQSKNGSWYGNFDRTVSIGFALAHSNEFPKQNLQKSIEFTDKVISKGYGQNAHTISKLLKFYFKSGRIQNDLVDYFNKRFRNDSLNKIENIKIEIANGNIETAIDLLRIQNTFDLNQAYSSEIILQSSKLADVNKEYRLGKIEYEKYKIEKTKITNGLLGLLDLIN